MKGRPMTKITVIASSTYPADFRMFVQKQSSTDGVNWSDDGAPVELAPGGKTGVSVASTARFYVSSETLPEFNGRFTFGGNAAIRIVTEGWNGQAWYDHAADDDPESPHYFGVWKDGFRFRVEAA